MARTLSQSRFKTMSIKSYLYLFYCLSFIIYLNISVHADTASSEEKIEKQSVSVISEDEIIRRRKVAQTYLSEHSSADAGWIETYQNSFPDNVGLNHEKIKTKVSLEDITTISSKLSNIGRPVEFLKIRPLDFEGSDQDTLQSDLETLRQVESVSHARKLNVVKMEHSKRNEFESSDYTVIEKEVEAYTSKTRSKGPSRITAMKSRCFICDDQHIFYGNCVKFPYSKCQAKSVLMNKKLFIEKHMKLHTSSDPVSNTGTYNQNYKSDQQEISSHNFDKREGDIFINEVSFNHEKIVVEPNDDLQDNNKGVVLNKKFEKAIQATINDHEVLRRKKVLGSLMSTLHQEQENWIETYHHSFTEDGPKKYDHLNKFVSDSEMTYDKYNSFVKNQKVPKSCVQESYILRWVNKLQNKYKQSDSRHDTYRLNILISSTALSNLENISKNFDINVLDEFISGLILESAEDSDYMNSFDISDIVFNPFYHNIFIAVLFAFVLFYYKCPLYIIMAVIAILWHGYKLYQQKIALKQNIMSSIPSSYCDSILNTESGIYAHFKEYFRVLWYEEDCKRYYEAVMVDPSAEISFPIIISNLVSETIFEGLGPFGQKLNVFFRGLTNRLSWFQQFFIFILLVILLTFFVILFSIWKKYRVHLPFFMGTVEPTVFSIGSKVEDVVLKKEKCLLKNSPTGSDAITENRDIDKFNSQNMSLNVPDLKNNLQSSNVLLPVTFKRNHSRHFSF